MTHASKMHQSVSLYIGKLGPACVCFYYHIPSELDGRAMPIDIQLLHTYVQLCTVATYYLLCFYAVLAFWDGAAYLGPGSYRVLSSVTSVGPTLCFRFCF